MSWQPHAGPQQDFCAASEDEVLFGGAAGPGKTSCLLVEATRFVRYPDYKAIIFRRTYPEITEILDRTREMYPMMGAEYRAGEHRWYFPSGATINLGHMADRDSEYSYQGKEFSYVGFDEAGQFLPKQLLYLFSRCRSTNAEIPKRIRYATNPGGPSHQFLKDRFRIAQYPQGGKTFFEGIDVVLPGGSRIKELISRRFVPGTIEDNPTLLLNDPAYVARLMQLPEIERMRLLEGRWDAFEGQKFAELNPEIHGFDGDLPPEWETFSSFDWGYARPWVYLVWRVDYDGRLYLDQMHYATKSDGVNIGVRQTDTEIARTILKLEREWKLKPRIRLAGADIFNPKRNKDGMTGPAPSEEMAREGVVFVKSDNQRILGWQQIHHRLNIDEEGKPWLYARSNLKDWWRTMLNLQEDPNNPEDIPTKDIEDHLPEATRYAVMQRPIRTKYKPESDVGSFQYERRKYMKAIKYASRYGVGLSAAYGKVR